MNLPTKVICLLMVVIVRISAQESMPTIFGKQPDNIHGVKYKHITETSPPWHKSRTWKRRDKRIIPASGIYVNDEVLAPKRGIEKKRNPEFRNLWKQHSLLMARKESAKNRMVPRRYGTVWIPSGWDIYRSGKYRGVWKRIQPMKTSIHKVQRIDTRSQESRSSVTHSPFDSKSKVSDFRAQRGRFSKHGGYSFNSRFQDSQDFRRETQYDDILIPGTQTETYRNNGNHKSFRLHSRTPRIRGLDFKTRRARVLESTTQESAEAGALQPGIVDFNIKTNTKYGRVDSIFKNDGVDYKTLYDDSAQAKGNGDRIEKGQVQEFRGLKAMKTGTQNSDQTLTNRGQGNQPSHHRQRLYSGEKFQRKDISTSLDSKDDINVNNNSRNYTWKYKHSFQQGSQNFLRHNRRSLTSRELDLGEKENSRHGNDSKLQNKSREHFLEERRRDVIENNQRRRILLEKKEQRRKMMMARRNRQSLRSRFSVDNDKKMRDGSGPVAAHKRRNDIESKYSRTNGLKIKTRFSRTGIAGKDMVARERQVFGGNRIYDVDSQPTESMDEDDTDNKYSGKERRRHTIRSKHPERGRAVIGRVNRKRKRFEDLLEDDKERNTRDDGDFRNHRTAGRSLLSAVRKNRRTRPKDRNVAPSYGLMKNCFRNIELTFTPRISNDEQSFGDELHRRGHETDRTNVNDVSMIKEHVLSEVIVGGRTPSQKSKKNFEEPIIIRVIENDDGRRTVKIMVASSNV